MLVKYISETSVEPYRGLVEENGTVYTNDEAKAKEVGFKELIVDEKPVPLDGFFATLYYENGQDAVFGRWKVEALEEVI